MLAIIQRCKKNKLIVDCIQNNQAISFVEIIVSIVLLGIVAVYSGNMRSASDKAYDNLDIFSAMEYKLNKLVEDVTINQGRYPYVTDHFYLGCYGKKLIPITAGFLLISNDGYWPPRNGDSIAQTQKLARECDNRAKILALIRPANISDNNAGLNARYVIRVISIQKSGQTGILKELKTFVPYYSVYKTTDFN